MITDEELMEQYQQGHVDAFNVLYQRYSKKLYGYLAKRLPGAQDELFQRVFLKLHENRLLYDPSQRFSPWFFTIARNTLVDYVRREQSKPAVTELDEERHGILGLEAVADDHKQTVLAQAITTLKPEDRSLLEKRYHQEASYNELASELGLSPVATRKRISRILNKIRSLLP